MIQNLEAIQTGANHSLYVTWMYSTSLFIVIIHVPLYLKSKFGMRTTASYEMYLNSTPNSNWREPDDLYKTCMFSTVLRFSTCRYIFIDSTTYYCLLYMLLLLRILSEVVNTKILKSIQKIGLEVHEQ